MLNATARELSRTDCAPQPRCMHAIHDFWPKSINEICLGLPVSVMPPAKALNAKAAAGGKPGAPSSRNKGGAATGGAPAGLPPKKQEQAAPAKQLTAKEKEEAMQLKTCTRWWNAMLLEAKTEHTVTDLTRDLATGIVPVALVEALSRTEIKHNKEPKNRIKQMENCAIFIRQLKALGINMTGVSAEDVADGKKALMLSLTWKLVVHFSASKESLLADDLLRWVQLNTAGYAGVNVDGWDGLRDGRALCALLHRYDPSALDFGALPDADAEGAALAALEIAFDTAESRFGAPKLLDAADIVGADAGAAGTGVGASAAPAPAPSAAAGSGGVTDLRSMLIYTIKLRQALRQHRDVRAQEAAGRCARFYKDATALLEWASDATQTQSDRTSIAKRLERTSKGDVAEADKMLGVLEDDFRGKEKAGQQQERSTLVSTRLPAIKATLEANEEADARFHHRLPGEPEPPPPRPREPPPGAAADDPDAAAAGVPEALVVVKSAKGATDELIRCLAALDKSWAALEAEEQHLSDALWFILVEKQTDLMVRAAEDEADDIEGLARAWAARLSSQQELRVLRFDDTKVQGQIWPKESGDSAAALAAAVDILERWAASSGDGASELDKRKKACLAAMAEAARRRQEEGRETPGKGLPEQLDEAWREMDTAAQELHVKLSSMLSWQKQQLEGTTARLATARRTLGSQRLPAVNSAAAKAAAAKSAAMAEQDAAEQAAAAQPEPKQGDGAARTKGAAKGGSDKGEGHTADAGEVLVKVKEEKGAGGCVLL